MSLLKRGQILFGIYHHLARALLQMRSPDLLKKGRGQKAAMLKGY
ncbi:MAG: hypothetical protein PUP91_17050 [Rhizonema sp. PD37]|nr:hypothetical protein [Rhizonema sp. PD37]